MNESKASYAITKILADSSLLPIEQQQVYAKIMTTLEEPDDEGKCQVCQAKIEKYTHPISKVLVTALIKVSRGVYMKSQKMPFTRANDIRISRLPEEIALTFDERGNFTKLRFHGLVAKVSVAGERKSNCWLITKKGWSFLRGEEIPEMVTTFRNKVIDHSTTTTTIHKIMAGGEYVVTLETLQHELADLPEDLE